MKALRTIFLIVSALITTPAALLLALVGCYFLWVGIAGLKALKRGLPGGVSPHSCYGTEQKSG